MGERQTIEVKNPALAANAMRAVGVWHVLGALRAQHEFTRLPGFALALALAEGVMADMRASIGADALREAHRAGFDIGQSKAVYTTLRNGKAALEIEMLDFADLAEQVEDRVDA